MLFLALVTTLSVALLAVRLQRVAIGPFPVQRIFRLNANLGPKGLGKFLQLYVEPGAGTHADDSTSLLKADVRRHGPAKSKHVIGVIRPHIVEETSTSTSAGGESVVAVVEEERHQDDNIHTPNTFVSVDTHQTKREEADTMMKKPAHEREQPPRKPAKLKALVHAPKAPSLGLDAGPHLGDSSTSTAASASDDEAQIKPEEVEEIQRLQGLGLVVDDKKGLTTLAAAAAGDSSSGKAGPLSKAEIEEQVREAVFGGGSGINLTSCDQLFVIQGTSNNVAPTFKPPPRRDSSDAVLSESDKDFCEDTLRKFLDLKRTSEKEVKMPDTQSRNSSPSLSSPLATLWCDFLKQLLQQLGFWPKAGAAMSTKGQNGASSFMEGSIVQKTLTGILKLVGASWPDFLREGRIMAVSILEPTGGDFRLVIRARPLAAGVEVEKYRSESPVYVDNFLPEISFRWDYFESKPRSFETLPPLHQAWYTVLKSAFNLPQIPYTRIVIEPEIGLFMRFCLPAGKTWLYSISQYPAWERSIDRPWKDFVQNEVQGRLGNEFSHGALVNSWFNGPQDPDAHLGGGTAWSYHFAAELEKGKFNRPVVVNTVLRHVFSSPLTLLQREKGLLRMDLALGTTALIPNLGGKDQERKTMADRLFSFLADFRPLLHFREISMTSASSSPAVPSTSEKSKEQHQQPSVGEVADAIIPETLHKEEPDPPTGCRLDTKETQQAHYTVGFENALETKYIECTRIRRVLVSIGLDDDVDTGTTATDEKRDKEAKEETVMNRGSSLWRFFRRAKEAKETSKAFNIAGKAVGYALSSIFAFSTVVQGGHAGFCPSPALLETGLRLLKKVLGMTDGQEMLGHGARRLQLGYIDHWEVTENGNYAGQDADPSPSEEGSKAEAREGPKTEPRTRQIMSFSFFGARHALNNASRKSGGYLEQVAAFVEGLTMLLRKVGLLQEPLIIEKHDENQNFYLFHLLRVFTLGAPTYGPATEGEWNSRTVFVPFRTLPARGASPTRGASPARVGPLSSDGKIVPEEGVTPLEGKSKIRGATLRLALAREIQDVNVGDANHAVRYQECWLPERFPDAVCKVLQYPQLEAEKGKASTGQAKTKKDDTSTGDGKDDVFLLPRLQANTNEWRLKAPPHCTMEAEKAVKEEVREAKQAAWRSGWP
ncbi:unnamed protein product [Amoebophrya sp. A25]|nr:unnamed protein product [Amoebophrya sp. A25]|eukprot:GSA25T00008112001.1